MKKITSDQERLIINTYNLYKKINIVSQKTGFCASSIRKTLRKHNIDIIKFPNKLKTHLQDTATKNGYTNFDINNYSGREYHIDHIIPCSAFNLSCSYHQKLCFNWNNPQILKAETNLIKGNKI